MVRFNKLPCSQPSRFICILLSVVWIVPQLVLPFAGIFTMLLWNLVPKLFLLPFALILFNYVTLCSFWVFWEKVLRHLLSRATGTQKEMLYKLCKPVTICDMKISIDLPSWGFQNFYSLLFFATEDLTGLLDSCQYMAVNFCTGSKFATPALFLCLLRSCKSLITLTVLYICKDLWPSPVVNHYPWSNWSLSPCSTFITLSLAVNDLPCTCRALSIAWGMRSSLAFLLWFKLLRFSGISCRSLCPWFHQHSLLTFSELLERFWI